MVIKWFKRQRFPQQPGARDTMAAPVTAGTHGYNGKYKPLELKCRRVSSAHCPSEGKEECRSCLRIACPVQWGAEGHRAPESPPGARAVLGAWAIQTLPLQQGWLRWGMRILESALEYQEEILLAMFSLNLCLLDTGQCPKGVCCPCRKREGSLSPSRERLLSLLHLSVYHPLNQWEMPFLCSLAQWWIPAALRGQGGERKDKGTVWLLPAEIHTLLRLALERVFCVSTAWGASRVTWAPQEATKGRWGGKGQISGHF